MRQRKKLSIVLLCALLAGSAAPAHSAEDGFGLGRVWSWLEAWLPGLSAAVAEQGLSIDPNGATSKQCASIDPNGATATSDQGFSIDPDGITSDEGLSIDPDGVTTSDQCLSIDPNG